MASGLQFLFLLCLTGGPWTGANANTDSDSCCKTKQPCKYCPYGWSQFGNRCYVYNPTEKDWASAERACIEEGGNLASIPDKAAFDNIKLTIQRATGEDKRAWVGGHDTVKEGLWLWSDGTKFDIKEWGPGQPNNDKDSEDCMEINFSGSLNDHDCTLKKPFVCSKTL